MCAKLWFSECMAYVSRSFLLVVDMFDYYLFDVPYFDVGVFFLIWLLLVSNYLLIRIFLMDPDEEIFFGG